MAAAVLAALLLFTAPKPLALSHRLSSQGLPPATPPSISSQKATRPASSREFGSFMLGQYAHNIEKKLGTPARTGVDEEDGETLWHYDLAPNEKTVLTFSLSKGERPTITLIEVVGEPSKDAPQLHGISLGATKAEVLQKLGPPDTTEPVEDGKGEAMDWEDRNYYVQLNEEGRVDMLQVVDNRHGYPEAEDAKPDLAGFQKALESRDRDAILEWLCADLDLYTKTDGTVTFVGSPREDLRNEETLISRYLFGGSGSVRDILTPEFVASAEQEEDAEEGEWISTFPEGSPVAAIRWAYEAGRWRVWEIFFEQESASAR